MISSFRIISVSGTSHPAGITGGVAEALVATATGLAIAIFSLIGYNWCRDKLRQITEEIELRATQFENIVAQARPRSPSKSERKSPLRIKRQPVEKARIELIPMIDTMAFLLVFFMIASLAMTQQLGVPVNLPKASTATRQPSSDHTLVVSVDGKGRLSVNKQSVAWTQLEGAVRARMEARPGLLVILNADEGLRHGAVMRVLDALKRAGARQIAIAATQPEKAHDATKP